MTTKESLNAMISTQGHPQSAPDDQTTPKSNRACASEDPTGPQIGTTAEPSDAQDRLRIREGLPADTVFLVSELGLWPPMCAPVGVWGLIVTAIDTRATDGAPPELFTGRWQEREPAASHANGDVAIRLHPTADDTDLSMSTVASDDHHPARQTEIELLIAHDGRWWSVARWPHAGQHWPVDIASTVATLMRIHTDLTEAARQPMAQNPIDNPGPAASADRSPADQSLPRRGPRIVLAQLVKAGLLQPGEQLYWLRSQKGGCHTGHHYRRGDAAAVRPPLLREPFRRPYSARFSSLQRLDGVAASR